MKKRNLLTILMFGMVTCIYAQKPTLELTFTADNNGQHVPLNSIMIENLTQGGDTTLYAPDTVLVLDYITGVDENGNFVNNAFSLFQNYPNPIKGKTTVCVRVPESARVIITISDIMGRKLINREYPVGWGSHSFTFYPGRENLYFLTAQTDHQSQTIKMINSPSHTSALGICKLEYNGTQSGSGEYKTGIRLQNFVFDLGDQLEYTASSALGGRTIIDTPYENITYTFQYASSGMPCPGTPTVTDIDGNVYNTVQIGTQCWMAENLKTTTYNNGVSIPNVTDASTWLNLTSGAYVWYDNDISWKDSYGALYNGYATVDPNGLCPTGWHVPLDDEWTELTDYTGGTWAPHGNKLKSCRQVDSPLGDSCNTIEHPRWTAYDSNHGTDDYGFSGFPGGRRNYNGLFSYLGDSGLWWSSTESSSTNAWNRSLHYFNGGVGRDGSDKRYGISVRCLRD